MLKGRPRRQVSVPAPRRQEPPLTTAEIRKFAARMAGLAAFIGIVYWLGWKSPWARADMHVRVEAPDAPKAIAAPVAAPAPPVTTVGSNETTESVRATESADQDQAEPVRERRSHRRARRESDERD